MRKLPRAMEKSHTGAVAGKEVVTYGITG